MKICPKFLLSVPKAELLPPPACVEVAFFGASNVGKSSLINAVCNQKNLAKTSKTPGRTQMLNFFSLSEDFVLVDVPGYGFANVPIEARQHWQNLLLGYLASRKSCLKAYILLDSRRFLRTGDLDLMGLLQQYNIDCALVFTKIDKLNDAEYKDLVLKAEAHFGNPCRVLFTSARTRAGIAELQQDMQVLGCIFEMRRG
jgi:GTP-binding protein